MFASMPNACDGKVTLMSAAARTSERKDSINGSPLWVAMRVPPELRRASRKTGGRVAADVVTRPSPWEFHGRKLPREGRESAPKHCAGRCDLVERHSVEEVSGLKSAGAYEWVRGIPRFTGESAGDTPGCVRYARCRSSRKLACVSMRRSVAMSPAERAFAVRVAAPSTRSSCSERVA